MNIAAAAVADIITSIIMNIITSMNTIMNMAAVVVVDIIMITRKGV